MGRLSVRLEHGKRITYKGSSGKKLVTIKPFKKRRAVNGSRSANWHVVIEECVDQPAKAT